MKEELEGKLGNYIEQRGWAGVGREVTGRTTGKRKRQLGSLYSGEERIPRLSGCTHLGGAEESGTNQSRDRMSP